MQFINTELPDGPAFEYRYFLKNIFLGLYNIWNINNLRYIFLQKSQEKSK